MNIDAIKVGRHAFAVKGVDPALLAEMMPGGSCVPLIQPQTFLATHEVEIVLVDFRHHCIFLRAERTVALGEFGEFSVYLECHCAAVA